MLTFEELRRVNVDRCENGFNHPLHSWKPERWSNAMAGEVGEACNAVKKLNRIEDGLVTNNDPETREKAVRAIADELADVVIYADLLAARLGVTLEEAVVNKFNATSDRIESQIKLGERNANTYS